MSSWRPRLRVDSKYFTNGGIYWRLCENPVYNSETARQMLIKMQGRCKRLTLHSSNIGALDIVLELGDLLLELVKRDLLVLDDESDLELLDTVADGDELGRAPDEAVLLDATDRLLESSHVGLIVPRLHLESNDGLYK